MAKASPRRPTAPLKVQDMGIGRADWFMLSSTRKVNKSYPHETAAADLFVTYYRYIEAWSYEPFVGSARADRGMKLSGKTFYFEVDLSTENLRIIEDKIKAYIRYGRDTGEQFYVVFDIVGNDASGVNRRTSDIGALLDRYSLANQFSLASHLTLTESGLEDEVLFSPEGRYSFASI
ncbi:MAG: hypothetical protein QOE33_476 [Acidobacteriota bacterium]|nr:hypothetical protein [Acidobacteriota bacterium]